MRFALTNDLDGLYEPPYIAFVQRHVGARFEVIDTPEIAQGPREYVKVARIEGGP